MRLTFFKTPRPKEFNYIPRYYDERKEEAEQRRKRIEQEMGISKSGQYVSGITRGSIQSKIASRRTSNRNSVIRLLVIISILILLTYLLLNGSFSFKFLGQ